LLFHDIIHPPVMDLVPVVVCHLKWVLFHCIQVTGGDHVFLDPGVALLFGSALFLVVLVPLSLINFSVFVVFCSLFLTVAFVSLCALL